MLKMMIAAICCSSILFAFDDGRDLVYDFHKGKWINKWENGMYFSEKDLKFYPYYSTEASEERYKKNREKYDHLEDEVKNAIKKF